MTNTYSTMPNSAAANSAQIVSGPAQPLAVTPSTESHKNAPWLASGFFMLPDEFLDIQHLLKAGTRMVYMAHVKNARPYGDGAGLSYAKRENIAKRIHRIVDTVDSGNAELIERNMISPVGRVYSEDGGPVIYKLNHPSMWKFDCLKSSAPQPKKCGTLAEKIRPITKTKEKEPKKEQNSDVVVSSISSNVSEPNRDVIERLTSEGVNFKVATQLAAENSAEVIEQQLEWLSDRNPKDRAATIVSSIKGAWGPAAATKTQGRVVEPVVANGGAYDDYKPQYRSKKSHVSTHLTTTSQPTSAPRQEPRQEPPTPTKETQRLDQSELAPPSPQEKAIQAHAIFLKLREEQQTELLELARHNVAQIWHDRVGVVDSPMSLELWEMVMERYSNS